MHSPRLLDEILALKLRLDVCEPSETRDIQNAIVERMGIIQSLTKLPWQRIRSVINLRYVEFVKAEKEAGRLRRVERTITEVIPRPDQPPSEPHNGGGI